MRGFWIWLFLLLMNFPALLKAQRSSGDDFYGGRWRGTPLYKWQGFYERTGLHFSLGATYTMTSFNEQNKTYTNEDTVTSASVMPRGRPGYYAKVGALHIFRFKRKIFQYIDYGVGIKQFGGREEYSAQRTINTAGVQFSQIIDETASFDNGYVFLDFNANNVLQFAPNVWLQNSIGFNIDYRIYGGEQYQEINVGTQDYQENFKADIHYKLGVGFKLVNGMYLIPTLETPVFTAYGWRKGNPSIHWFSSNYQPITLSLKFAFLFKKDPEDCPPVFSPGDKEKSKKYQKTN